MEKAEEDTVLVEVVGPLPAAEEPLVLLASSSWNGN
jgi:hypothetical protein